VEIFDIFYDHLVYVFYGRLIYFLANLVYFKVIWYQFSRFGMLYLDKSGNPGFRSGGAKKVSAVVAEFEIEIWRNKTPPATTTVISSFQWARRCKTKQSRPLHYIRRKELSEVNVTRVKNSLRIFNA
jgi:hypothetical protein